MLVSTRCVLRRGISDEGAEEFEEVELISEGRRNERKVDRAIAKCLKLLVVDLEEPATGGPRENASHLARFLERRGWRRRGCRGRLGLNHPSIKMHRNVSFRCIQVRRIETFRALDDLELTRSLR